VEWEESAIDFLLSRGLTSQLGARPLRRAVEKFALTPIAQEILIHDIPKGDQFLFVRSDGKKIEVDFVDPDAVTQEAEEAELPPVEISGEDLRSGSEAVARVALRGSGRLEEVMILADRVEVLDGRIESEEWDNARNGDMKQMTEAGFWDSQDRLPVLASAELRDRIESGTCTARSLLDRLGGDAENSRDRYPSEVIRRLAMQIHLLENALQVLDENLPQDAFIRITPVKRDKESSEDSAEWAKQVKEMVTTWATKRNMKLQECENPQGDQAPDGAWVAAVNGFAAYSLLEPLAGIHELERPEASRNDRRLHVRIEVVPRPLGIAPSSDAGLATQASEVLTAGSSIDEVVRRYRIGENPKLVDLRQGWRCASPGDALAGDFDLVGSLAALTR
jgi:ATP-dependent Clp protease ATP-binding subunit ClpC